VSEPVSNIDLGQYSAEQRKTMEQAIEVMTTNLLWDHDAISSAMGRAWTTVARFLQGKPQGDIGEVIADFARLVARYGATTLVRTPIVDDYERVLANCRHDGRMGAIVARNGRGKSTTVRDWARRTPRARAVVVQCPSQCTRGDLVSLLLAALDVTVEGAKQPDRERALREHLTARHMLIVDEAGYLVSDRRKTSPLRMLQDLHDLCGCPVVLVMRPAEWDALVAGRTVYEDEQLLGRILHRSIVRFSYKSAEIEPILRRFCGDPSKSLRAAVRDQLSRQVGGLRALCADLSLAADFARRDGFSFDEAFLAAASARETAPTLAKLDDF